MVVDAAELTENGGVVGVTAVHGTTKITLESAWVVAKTTVRTRSSVVQSSNGPKVDTHVGKRPSGNEATTGTSGKMDGVAGNARRRDNGRTIMRDELSISAQAVRIAVEKGRFFRC